MSEFKFNCPGCGQHILANDKWVGRRINCPSCDTRIGVPPPAKRSKKAGVAAPSTVEEAGESARMPKLKAKRTDVLLLPPGQRVRGTHPKLPTAHAAEEAMAKKKTRSVTAHGADLAPGRKEGKATQSEAAKELTKDRPVMPPEQLRVAVLSPAVKLDVVRAVRLRIADEAGWLPGKVQGATAYAGKMENGELVLVEAKSPDATRFSLIGAFLREMNVRRVVRSATGRRRFLDEEIPEVIREVLLEGVSDEEREGAEKRLSGRELESISHEQCLAVLGVLESRYMQRAEEAQIEKAKRRFGNVRLPELAKKLEQKARIKPEEVAAALYHELMEVRRRLERLESRNGGQQ